jgi:hypothetical protein
MMQHHSFIKPYGVSSLGFSASDVFGREEGQKSSETMEMQKMFLCPLFVFCLPSASQEDANAKEKRQKEQALNQSAKQPSRKRAPGRG